MKKYLSFSILSSLMAAGFVFAASNGALAADCADVGKRVAEQQGGKLARSTPVVQDGKEMCVVVVLVDGRDGEKPRRVEVAVPAN